MTEAKKMLHSRSFITIPINDLTEKRERAGALKLPIPKVLVLYTGGTIGMKIEGNVYSPKPNYMEKSLRDLIILNNKTIAERMKLYDKHLDFLYLESNNKQSIAYYIVEYEPLLDSSCMRLEEYTTIAKDIEKEYDNYSGFVILIGTDTMAYAASYLSFMFENLGKPVVLTGSQIPIFETRSDARDNITGSLIIAGLYSICEVTIFFNNRLLRGNRTTKVNCNGLQAFESPNFPALADLGYNIKVRWDIVIPKKPNKEFKVFTDMSKNVAILRIFPSLSPNLIRLFCQPPLEAIIMQTYGMGNVPVDNPEFMSELNIIAKTDIIVLNCTQCQIGSVSSIYEAGATLPDMGIISGRDMTIESALAKLSYLLGHKQWSIEEKKKRLDRPLRGESCEIEEESPNLCSIPMEIVNCSDAARSGQIELLRTALESGKSPNAKDPNGYDAMYYAVTMNNTPMIELLKNHNSKLNISDIDVGILACRASATNDVQTLKNLVLAGVPLSKVDYSGNTAAHIAAMFESKDCLDYLLASLPNLFTVKNKFGITPKVILKDKSDQISKEIIRTLKKTKSQSGK